MDNTVGYPGRYWKTQVSRNKIGIQMIKASIDKHIQQIKVQRVPHSSSKRHSKVSLLSGCYSAIVSKIKNKKLKQLLHCFIRQVVICVLWSEKKGIDGDQENTSTRKIVENQCKLNPLGGGRRRLQRHERRKDGGETEPLKQRRRQREEDGRVR